MLIKEYAIEPDVLTQSMDMTPIWQALNQFGIEHGRVITSFPKTWIRIIEEKLNPQLGDVQKKRMKLKLQRIADRVIIRPNLLGRTYEGLPAWRENVFSEHAKNPFQGIILTDNDDHNDIVLTEYDLDDSNPLWKSSRSNQVLRDKESLVNSMSMLAKISNDLHFVDPYFDGDRRWTEVISGCISKRLEHRPQGQSEFVIHTTRAELNHFKHALPKTICPQLSKHTMVKLIKWESLQDIERMHARYLLTDKGGLAFDSGLDTKPGDSTDVHILDSQLHEMRLGQLQDNSKVYRKVFEASFNSNGLVERA